MATGVEKIKSTGMRPVPASKDSRQARHSRFLRPTQVVLGACPSEALDVLEGERAWPDHAHLSSQDIVKLGCFVESGGTQPRADARDLSLPHGAKLEDPKRTALVAEAKLAEENAFSILDSRGDSESKKERAQQDEPDEGRNNIERTQQEGMGSAIPLLSEG